MPVPVGDLDTAHDPGAAGAQKRSDLVGEAGAEPIEAPGGHEIRVGTASWTDPTMTAAGVFYPPGADTAEERLQYYASQFPLVEVDATYYALPVPRMAELWRERTPPDFTFDIKAHALLTGQPSETKRLPKDIRTALPEDLAAKPRIYARDLRLSLMREHLDQDDDEDLLDPGLAVRRMHASAAALQAWHDDPSGARPTGRLRPLAEDSLSDWTRRWATLAYHRVYDPDGRPRSLRRRRAF